MSTEFKKYYVYLDGTYMGSTVTLSEEEAIQEIAEEQDLPTKDMVATLYEMRDRDREAEQEYWDNHPEELKKHKIITFSSRMKLKQLEGEVEDLVKSNPWWINKDYQSTVIKKINTELKKMNEEDLEEILDLLKSRRVK